MVWYLINAIYGNKDNRVAASFSSCTEVYLHTGYYELFYSETQIALFYL